MGLVVADLMAKLGLDSREFDRGITGLDKQAGRLKPTLQDISNKMQTVGKSMSTFVTLPVLAGLGLSVKAASDLEETMNKVDVVFGSAAGSVKKFMSDAATALGMSKQQAGEATATFGNLLAGTGKSKDEVAKMSENLVQLASDMSSFNNIPMAEALEKIRSGLVGEAEPLRAVGVLLDDAALRQKALSMGIVSNTTDVLSPNNKMLAAYALILDKTKVQQGDFARTSDGLANSIRTAGAELKDMAAAFGEDLIPLAKDALGIIKPLIGVFKDMPDPVRKVVIGVGLLAAAIGPLSLAGSGMFKFYGGLKEVLGWLPGRVGKTIIAAEAETVAITGQTVAIEANTVARAANGAIPLGTGSYGIGRGALPLGAAGGAALGGLALVGMEAAVIASAAMAIALPIALATYKEHPLSPSGATVTGGQSMGGRGPGSGMAYEQALTASAPAIAKRVAGMNKLVQITKELNLLKPSATTVGLIAQYDQRLNDLKFRYPQLKAQIDKVKTALDKQGDAFEASSEAAKKAADDIIKAYSTMADFFKATNLAAIMGTPLPTAAQAAFASQSDQAAAFAKAQEAGYFTKQYAASYPTLVKGKWITGMAAGGYVPARPGGTQVTLGEGGEGEHVIPDSRMGGRAIVVHVNFHGAVVGGKAGLRELSGMVQRDVMSGVRRGLVGQNA